MCNSRHRKFFTKSRKAFYRHLVLISCFQIPTTIYNTSNHIPVTMSDTHIQRKKIIHVIPEKGQVQCWQGPISLQLCFLNYKLHFLKWMFVFLIRKTSSDFLSSPLRKKQNGEIAILSSIPQNRTLLRDS